MATYESNVSAFYQLDFSIFPTNGDYIVINSFVRDETFSDENDDPPDSTFEVPEPLNGLQSGQDQSYKGTIEIDGRTFVVTQEGDPNSWTIFGNVPDPDTFVWPEPINESLINTDPFPVCFAAGTLIATPSGARPVERLKPGETLCTAGGGTTQVRWVGRQTLHKRFMPPERFRPVRIEAGALGAGLPARALTLTSDHALCLNGCLVQAGTLVNGATITRVPLEALPDRVPYYHVETIAHEIILAEGTPAETFVDNVTRQAFDNHSDYVRLYGATAPPVVEMDLPRVMSARQLPAHMVPRLVS